MSRNHCSCSINIFIGTFSSFNCAGILIRIVHREIFHVRKMVRWMWIAICFRKKNFADFRLNTYILYILLYELWTTNINHSQTNYRTLRLLFQFISHVLLWPRTCTHTYSHMYIIGQMVKSIAFLSLDFISILYVTAKIEPWNWCFFFCLSHDDNYFNWLKRKCFNVRYCILCNISLPCWLPDDTVFRAEI